MDSVKQSGGKADPEIKTAGAQSARRQTNTATNQHGDKPARGNEQRAN